MGGILLRQPPDLVDLLLDFQTLKVVELGLMALEGAVDIVLSLREWLSLALWKEIKRESVEMCALARTETVTGQFITPGQKPAFITMSM